MNDGDGAAQPDLSGLPAAAVEMGVAAPAAMIARRGLGLGWRKATGSSAPSSHPERSTKRPFLETLIWSVAVAAVAAAARVIVWRLVLRLRKDREQPPQS